MVEHLVCMQKALVCLSYISNEKILGRGGAAKDFSTWQGKTEKPLSVRTDSTETDGSMKDHL